MNLKHIENYYRVNKLLERTLQEHVSALREMIARYEEERFNLLVERAVAADLGWCRICCEVLPLERLQLAVHGTTLTVCCENHGYFPVQLRDGKLVIATFRGAWIPLNLDSGRVEGIFYPSYQMIHRMIHHRIPEELVSFFNLPPAIELTDEGILLVGGKPIPIPD